jgi:3-methyladenine DNA glycosylase AlkD
LIACLVVHDQTSPDSTFVGYLEIIKRESVDARNYVKKAVSWALRQIGKRNAALRKVALDLAKEFSEAEDVTRRWIGRDTLSDLTKKQTEPKAKQSTKPAKAKKTRAAR